MKNTVIFDMDGVIVDTEPLHRKAFFQHFNQLDIEINEDLYTKFTGKSTRNVYQGIKDHFSLNHEVENLVQDKRNIFNGLFDTDESLDLLPGVKNLIEDLHKNGFQMVLASSSAKVTIHKIFSRFNLYPYFSHILSGEDFPQSKPDPSIFIAAQKISENSADQCIVIEDSTNGIKAANAANIFCVGYKSLHSKQQNYDTADLVIQDFSEIDAKKIKEIE